MHLKYVVFSVLQEKLEYTPQLAKALAPTVLESIAGQSGSSCHIFILLQLANNRPK